MRRPHQLHARQHGPARPNRHGQRRHPARAPPNLRLDIRSHNRRNRPAVVSEAVAEFPAERGRAGHLHHPADGVRGSVGLVDAYEGGIHGFKVRECEGGEGAERGGIFARFARAGEYTVGVVRAAAADRAGVEMSAVHAGRVGASAVRHSLAGGVDVQPFGRDAAGQVGASDG